MEVDASQIDPRLIAWARRSGWKEFTRVQERVFRIILDGRSDLIIGGATSSGKTEAAFLPLISMAAKRRGGVCVLCISPTRALINDQYRRLVGIAGQVNVPVHKWHGEASVHGKKALIANPRGIVLMTPESLEGRLIRQPRLVKRLFANLDAIVIDELHQFLSGPRGHQLASQLARLDLYADAPVRRIGITATLGDVEYARRWLSPTDPKRVRLIDGPATGSRLLSRIRGYEAPIAQSLPTGRRRLQARQRATLSAIAATLLERHKSGTHLVFAGTKRDVEMLCSDLKARAAAASLPDRFRAHHGSMGKNERERLEEDLRTGTPTTVVTTTTLELGLDIGAVDAVDQIGAPRSLTEFRQRVGRSGRRAEPAMVTIHVTEEPLEAVCSLLDGLRLNTVRAVAVLNLLEKRFVEPPEPDGTMLTVVFQQTLSFVHEKEGASLPDLARLMRAVPPFQRLSEKSYTKLLAELCSPGLDLLYEAPDGKYRLSQRGEKLLESQEIYAAFSVCQTWDVWSRSEQVGSLLRSMPMAVGDLFSLGGRAWQVIAVDEKKNRIMVEPGASGAAPYFNISSGGAVHALVSAEMRRLLADDCHVPSDCDRVSAGFLGQGRTAFAEAGLSDRIVVDDEAQGVCHVFTWKGTRFNSLLAVLLRFKRFGCDFNEVAVSVASASSADIVEALSGDLPTIEDLSGFVEWINVGKFDKWVPEELLREDWAKRHKDLEQDLKEFCSSLSRDSSAWVGQPPRR